MQRFHNVMTARVIQSLLGAFVLALMLHSAAWASTTFSDSTFDAGDWALFEFTFDSGGSVSVSQELTGGNPSAFRKITNLLLPPTVPGIRSQIWGFHLRSGAIFDPGTLGAISSIDHSEDTNFMGPPGRGQSIALALRQSGNFYVGPFLKIGPSFGEPIGVWLSKQLTGLVQTDFQRLDPTGPSDPAGLPLVDTDHPDFSSTGAPIEFGFVRLSTTRSATQPLTVISGIDNWQVTVHTAVVSVTIDIKPGSDPNSINLCSKGAVPIAILGSATFDVNDVNTDTLRFAEASVKVVGKKDPHSLCSYEDVNGDFITDLVCHFVTTDIAGLDGESTSATLNGELNDGRTIEGTDSINIVKDTCN